MCKNIETSGNFWDFLIHHSYFHGKPNIKVPLSLSLYYRSNLDITFTFHLHFMSNIKYHGSPNIKVIIIMFPSRHQLTRTIENTQRSIYLYTWRTNRTSHLEALWPGGYFLVFECMVLLVSFKSISNMEWFSWIGCFAILYPLPRKYRRAHSIISAVISSTAM